MSNKALSFLVCLLILIKILSIYFTNFNLFGDEAQYWLWSKELDFGYFSKPPFLSWFIAAYTNVIGDSFFSLKILPTLIYFSISLALYSLCRNIGLEKTSSTSCVLIFLFIPAVSFSSFIISTDLFLLFFWTLSLNMVIKIKKTPNTKNFVLLGIFLGLALLSKYAAIYFILCFFIYVLLDKEFRNLLLFNYLKFILCIFCIIFVIMPNIVWNINNSWVTFQHTSDNANFGNIKINFLRGFEFLVIQILMLGPILFIANVVNYKKINIKPNTKFLLIFSLPIFLIVFVEAVIVRANANWAAPALISFFLFLYINIIGMKSLYFRLNIFFNFLFCVIFFILVGLSYPSKMFDRISGLNVYANEILNEGQKNGVRDYVISDRLLFASVSYELRNYDLNFFMPHKLGEKTTNHFKITSPLKEEMNRSFVFIGDINEINYLINDFTCKQKENGAQYETPKIILPSFKVCFN